MDSTVGRYVTVKQGANRAKANLLSDLKKLDSAMQDTQRSLLATPEANKAEYMQKTREMLTRR